MPHPSSPELVFKEVMVTHLQESSRGLYRNQHEQKRSQKSPPSSLSRSRHHQLHLLKHTAKTTRELSLWNTKNLKQKIMRKTKKHQPTRRGIAYTHLANQNQGQNSNLKYSFGGRDRISTKTTFLIRFFVCAGGGQILEILLVCVCEGHGWAEGRVWMESKVVKMFVSQRSRWMTDKSEGTRVDLIAEFPTAACTPHKPRISKR